MICSFANNKKSWDKYFTTKNLEHSGISNFVTRPHNNKNNLRSIFFTPFWNTCFYSQPIPRQCSISSVIRQKGESQNGCFKKIKYAKFSEKRTILTPLIRTRTCAYQWVRNVRFFGKFDVLCFLEKLVLRFALLPYYRRFLHPLTHRMFSDVFRGIEMKHWLGMDQDLHGASIYFCGIETSVIRQKSKISKRR